MAEHLQESGETAPKLTEWAKEPTLAELKLDWEASKPSHDIMSGKFERWNNLLKVEGSAKPKKIKGRSSVQPKLIRRQAEWRYSALSEPFLGTDKLFKIKPATFEDKKAAEQNELVLEYQFRTKLDRVKFIDDFVRSTVDEGTSIIRVGWKRATIMVKTEVPVYDHMPIEDEEQQQMLSQALELRLSNTREYNETAPPEIKAAVDYYDESGEATIAIDSGRTETVEVEKILENRPTAEVMNPKNVYVDPSCNGDPAKADFIAVTFETSKAELIKDGRYKNLDQVLWDSNSPVNTPDHETNTPQDFATQNTLRRKVVAHEYWGYFDINGDDRLVPIVATWIGNVLVRLEENPFPNEKLPFIFTQYLPVKRDIYGEPDAELLEDNQAILGAVSRGIIDLLGRSANGQQGFAKGMLDPLNRRRFENGQDYEFNPNVSPTAGHIEHKYPEIPQSAMVMMGHQNQEAEALTGVKSFSGGMSGEAYGDVAAGIRGVLDAASKREMGILRRLAKSIAVLGEFFASMNAAFLSEEETIRITNGEFQKVLREDLKGNFDIKVDISTAEIDAAQAQDLSFMLQTMGNTLPQEFTLMILAEIARLKRMPDLAQKLLTFKPEPDPNAVKIQELQIAKLEAEIAKIKSETIVNGAKAELTEAQADTASLDFVERETGTTHARDMEKQRGQAEGNIDLEITRAIAKPKKEGESKPDIESAIGFSRLANKRDNDDNTVSAIPPRAPVAPVPVMPAPQPQDLMAMDPRNMAAQEDQNLGVM